MKRAPMSLQAEIDEMTPKKEPILGQNTPITLGIVASIVAMAVGIGVTAGTVNKDLATVNLKIDAIERRELSGAKSQIDIASRLARIEALLEDIRRR